MKSLIAVATSKAISSKSLTAFRDKLRPGTYKVDATVRIMGELTVGEPTTQRLVNKVDFELLAILALNGLNEQTVTAIVNQYESAKVDGALPDLKEAARLGLKDSVWALVENLKDETEAEVRGKVTSRLVCEEVS